LAWPGSSTATFAWAGQESPNVVQTPAVRANEVAPHSPIAHCAFAVQDAPLSKSGGGVGVGVLVGVLVGVFVGVFVGVLARADTVETDFARLAARFSAAERGRSAADRAHPARRTRRSSRGCPPCR
jgi:hypothetical protein